MSTQKKLFLSPQNLVTQLFLLLISSLSPQILIAESSIDSFLANCQALTFENKIKNSFQNERTLEQAKAYSQFVPSLRVSTATNDNSLSKRKIRYGLSFENINPIKLMDELKTDGDRKMFYSLGAKEKVNESKEDFLALLFEYDNRKNWNEFIKISFKENFEKILKQQPKKTSREEMKDQLDFLAFRNEAISNNNKLYHMNVLLKSCNEKVEEIVFENLPKLDADRLKKIYASHFDNPNAKSACQYKVELKRKKNLEGSRWLAPNIFAQVSRVDPISSDDESYNEVSVGINLDFQPWRSSESVAHVFDDCVLRQRKDGLDTADEIILGLANLQNYQVYLEQYQKLKKMRDQVFQKVSTGAIPIEDFSNYLLQVKDILDKILEARKSIYIPYYLSL